MITRIELASRLAVWRRTNGGPEDFVQIDRDPARCDFIEADAILSEVESGEEDANRLFPPILQKVCDAVHGPGAKDGVYPSWHDLGERVAALKAAAQNMRNAIGAMLNETEGASVQDVLDAMQAFDIAVTP